MMDLSKTLAGASVLPVHSTSSFQIVCAVLSSDVPDLQGSIGSPTGHKGGGSIKLQFNHWGEMEGLPCSNNTAICLRV